MTPNDKELQKALGELLVIMLARSKVLEIPAKTVYGKHITLTAADAPPEAF